MSIDVELYTWANKTLWTEIEKEKDFEAELSYYKSINNLVGAYCKADVLLLRVSRLALFVFSIEYQVQSLG